MSIEKFNNLTVFITGSCGTIGKEIIRILISETSASVIAVDNNETELFFQQEKYKSGGRVKCFLVDIRDKEELLSRMKGADIVLHTAALKHVGICETSPAQAIQTNIIGTQNVIDAASLNNVEPLDKDLYIAIFNLISDVLIFSFSIDFINFDSVKLDCFFIKIISSSFNFRTNIFLTKDIFEFCNIPKEPSYITTIDLIKR